MSGSQEGWPREIVALHEQSWAGDFNFGKTTEVPWPGLDRRVRTALGLSDDPSPEETARAMAALLPSASVPRHDETVAFLTHLARMSVTGIVREGAWDEAEFATSGREVYRALAEQDVAVTVCAGELGVVHQPIPRGSYEIETPFQALRVLVLDATDAILGNLSHALVETGGLPRPHWL